MNKIHECPIQNIHPTQITIGLIEVSDKCLELGAVKKKRRQGVVFETLIPAVIGPSGTIYITDDHHLVLAAWHLGIPKARFAVEANLSKLKGKRFWNEMIKNHWAHPVDERGKVCPPSVIPGHVSGMRDDVYRSLARRVREDGGYKKTPTAFADFRWADFFRERISIGPTRKDFNAAVREATKLAGSKKAKGLPGFKK